MTLSARSHIEACGHPDADPPAIAAVGPFPPGAEGGGEVVALGQAAAPDR